MNQASGLEEVKFVVANINGEQIRLDGKSAIVMSSTIRDVSLVCGMEDIPSTPILIEKNTVRKAEEFATDFVLILKQMPNFDFDYFAKYFSEGIACVCPREQAELLAKHITIAINNKIRDSQDKVFMNMNDNSLSIHLGGVVL